MGRYASRSKFVELEINGNYLGVYVFMEKLKRDINRIDIEKLNPADSDPATITGGYILKIDKTTGGDLNIDQPLEYFEHTGMMIYGFTTRCVLIYITMTFRRVRMTELRPNINDGFTGKAPDIGAYEIGKPKPHYGPRPRSVDESTIH